MEGSNVFLTSPINQWGGVRGDEMIDHDIDLSMTSLTFSQQFENLILLL